MIDHVCSGLLFAVLISGVMTDAIKDAVGRPRPDFFWRCFPDGKGVCFFSIFFHVCSYANIFRAPMLLSFFILLLFILIIRLVLDMCRYLIKSQLVFYAPEIRMLLKKDIKVSRVGILPVRKMCSSELCYLIVTVYFYHFVIITCALTD